MAYSDDPQVQTMIDNMPEKTGKPLAEWLTVLNATGLDKHGQLVKFLKSEHGVSHGFANASAPPAARRRSRIWPRRSTQARRRRSGQSTTRW